MTCLNFLGTRSTLILAISLLAVICEGIHIPIRQGEFRCMLVYSFGQDETVKIDINLPPLPL